MAFMSARTWLAILLLLTIAVAEATPWGPDNYPDPKRDVQLCGRKGKSSNICDPDGVLSLKGADRVEGVLKDIWEGVDPYVRAQCGQVGRLGYQVAVAVMRRMEIRPREQAADAAQRIAKALHAKWGVGLAACDNGVLLLLAVDDRQVYISTGKGSQKAISDNALGDIISSMRPKLRAQNYDEAVEQAVVDVGLGLAGRRHGDGDWEWFPVIFFGIVGFMMLRGCWTSYKARRQYKDCRTALKKVKDEQEKLRTKEWSKPRTCPVCLEEFSVNPETIPEASAPPMPGTRSLSDEDEDLSEDPSAPLLPSESGNDLRASTGGHGEDSSGNPSSSKAANGGASSSPSPGLRRRNSGHVETSPFGNGAAAAAGGKGCDAGDGPSRNPITLRCGHTFCEPCLERWLEKAATCPICRERVDGGDGAAPPPVQQNHRSEPVGRRRYLTDDLLTAELVFRLMRLQNRYPSYITPGLIDTWREEATSTGSFDFERAREFQLNDPAIRASNEMRGSGGNAMSFGGGGGGGGGGRGGSW